MTFGVMSICLKYLQGWWLLCFHLLIPMFNYAVNKEILLNIQCRLFLMLEAISLCPTTCHLGKYADSLLAATSLKVVVGSDEVSSQPSLLQSKQSQHLQLLLIICFSYFFPQHHCFYLNTLKQTNILFTMRGPKLEHGNWDVVLPVPSARGQSFP